MRPISLSELAILTGRDHRTIASHVADAGLMPIGKKGRAILYDSALALRAVFGGKGNLSPADRLTDTRCQIAALDLAERQGEMVPVAGLQLALEGCFGRVRQRMLAAPSRAAAQMPAAVRGSAIAVFEAEVHSCLTEIANFGRENGV